MIQKSYAAFNIVLDEVFQKESVGTLQGITKRLLTKGPDGEIPEPTFYFELLTIRSAHNPWAYDAALEVCEDDKVLTKLRPHYTKARSVVKAFLLSYCIFRNPKRREFREREFREFKVEEKNLELKKEQERIKMEQEKKRQEILSKLTGSLYKNNRLLLLGSLLNGEDTEINRLCDMCGFRFRLHSSS